MKVCENCGDEIFTKEGENLCSVCEPADVEDRAKQRRKMQRKAREDALRSLGLTKVRGALGGTYWE